MKAKTITRFACRTITSLFAAGALMAGCSSGGTGTTSAGFDEGTMVPFSFTATGKPGAMEKKASDQAADTVASPTEGHFGITETDNTDQCTSTCTFSIDHPTATPNVWVTACSELAGTACSIPGHNIFLTTDPTFCGTKDNCLFADITASTSTSASCGLFVSGNKLSSKILTGGLDRIDLVEKSDFNCTTTAVGDFKQAGVRIAAVVGTNVDGTATFPSALNGTVSFEPSAGFVSDAALDALYDEGYVWNTSQKASAVYRVADKDNMAITAKVIFPITLTGSVTGGVVTAVPQFGLLAGLELCDEIDTGPAFCDSVATALTPTFTKLGSSMTNEKAAKLSMSTVGTDKIASMKIASSNKAALKTYTAGNSSWEDVSSFSTAVPNEIDDIAMSVNENFENTVVSVLTTDKSTLNGTVVESQDGITWNTLATIEDQMNEISMVSDLNSDAGYVYVGYKDALGTAVVRYCNVDGCFDTQLESSMQEQLAGFTSVTSMSNLAYDRFDGAPSVAVGWKDDNGAEFVSVMTYSDGWNQSATTFTATAKQMSLAKDSTISQDQRKSMTVVEYVDENGDVQMVSYDSNKESWNSIIGLRTASYAAVDEVSRMALVAKAATSTVYTAVRDNVAMKIVEVNTATAVVKEIGLVELKGYSTSYAAIVIPQFSTLDVAYENDTLGYAIAKEASISSGGPIIICDGKSCDTGGGPK